MLYKKDYIRLFIGFLIIVFIFIFIGISTYLEKFKGSEDLLMYEDKFSNNIPEEYYNEVIDPAQFDCKNVKIDSSEKIVGFSLSSEPKECFDLLKNNLLSKGWSFVESGSSSSASFYKENGKYTWLFLNCVYVGGETSIVLTCN